MNLIEIQEDSRPLSPGGGNDDIQNAKTTSAVSGKARQPDPYLISYSTGAYTLGNKPA